MTDLSSLFKECVQSATRMDGNISNRIFDSVSVKAKASRILLTLLDILKLSLILDA
jgi:hypothetical protein